MSEPKYWLVGKVSVPEEKKAELNSAVLEVLNLCGIRKKKEITLAGKPITVLERPLVDENGIVEFDYSIFGLYPIILTSVGDNFLKEFDEEVLTTIGELADGIKMKVDVHTTMEFLLGALSGNLQMQM